MHTNPSQPLSRRHMLRQAAAVPGMLGATAFLSPQSLAESTNGQVPRLAATLPREPSE